MAGECTLAVASMAFMVLAMPLEVSMAKSIFWAVLRCERLGPSRMKDCDSESEGDGALWRAATEESVERGDWVYYEDVVDVVDEEKAEKTLEVEEERCLSSESWRSKSWAPTGQEPARICLRRNPVALLAATATTATSPFPD